MKIARSERVRYELNPLAEVICQIQFNRIDELIAQEPDGFSALLSADIYPVRNIEQPVGITVQFGDHPNENASLPPPKVYHFAAQDGAWRVSVCADFAAVTCWKYTSWDEFRPRVEGVVELFMKCYPATTGKRVGLRYKDVVEREPLGLEKTPWHELVKPFLLGPLAPGALDDDFAPDIDPASNLLMQSMLKLDDCMLLLQSSLLRSAQDDRRAFLIDADFFSETDLSSDSLRDKSLLEGMLEKLHNNAGALFRRCITETLHHALRPQHQ